MCGSVDDNLGTWRFAWTKSDQGLILSSLFVGYYLSQLPSSLASIRFSPTRVLTLGLLVVSALQVLTVFAATRLSIEWLMLVRLLTGFADGFLYASSFAVAGLWSPYSEKSLFAGLVGSAVVCGNVLTYAASAPACGVVDLQGGWPFIFYSLAVLGLALALMFHFLVTDSPFGNECMPKDELISIAGEIPMEKSETRSDGIPFRVLITSRPVWAMVVSQAGSDWMMYVMVSVGPMYLKEVLHLSDTELSLLTGMPFLLTIPCVSLAGRLSDHLVAKGVVTNTQIRKLNDAVAKLVPASAVIGLSYLPAKSLVGVMCLNIAGTVALGFSSVSWQANPVDLAPSRAGLLAGVSQVGAVWVGFVVPVVFDHLTSGRTREQWRLAFSITAVIQVVTFVFYCVFASGEVQPWGDVSIEGCGDHGDVTTLYAQIQGDEEEERGCIGEYGIFRESHPHCNVSSTGTAKEDRPLKESRADYGSGCATPTALNTLELEYIASLDS